MIETYIGDVKDVPLFNQYSKQSSEFNNVKKHDQNKNEKLEPDKIVITDNYFIFNENL